MLRASVALLALLVYSIECRTAVPCTRHGSVIATRRSLYSFSLEILDRVSIEEDAHFVFSPLASWLQISYLLEGSDGRTKAEIFSAAGFPKQKCYRIKFRRVLDKMLKQSKEVDLKTVIVIDELLNLKKRFEKELTRSEFVKVLKLNFNNPGRASDQTSEYLDKISNGRLEDFTEDSNFGGTTLLLYNIGYFKSDWAMPFNPKNTAVKPFYAADLKKQIGEVNMMSHTGVYNMTVIPKLSLKVLQIPTNNTRISLLVLKTTDNRLSELFLTLKGVRVASFFNTFKEKTVHLSLPRFNTQTTMNNLPELYDDMGITQIFNPDTANLTKISNFKLYASVMTQASGIDVTEGGVKAYYIAESLTRPNISSFELNSPFAYMLVDTSTYSILFAGVYSSPSLY